MHAKIGAILLLLHKILLHKKKPLLKMKLKIIIIIIKTFYKISFYKDRFIKIFSSQAIFRVPLNIRLVFDIQIIWADNTEYSLW